MLIFIQLKNKLDFFFTGIKNVIIFFPVIWKFRNYDYAFTLEVLRVCLTQLRDEFDNTSYILQEQAYKHSLEVNNTIKAIDIILNEGYLEKENTEHERIYGKLLFIKNQLHFSKAYDIATQKEADESFKSIALKEQKRKRVALKMLRRQLRYLYNWWV